ncbi:tripartite tricarboxylate transporter permease [Falsirhodobacter xinxiangensis]|uniref:tripartite tricarboxylate transporter permease n=1 Tax=Falsirhodobacter xinxiangensis TaxID=2530049 RepID=UPI0010AA7B5F|nr:tripartite tricarboxylate transporter permease [Rhodobacter xinxiangensis]
MEIFANLSLGFETALNLQNVIYCLLGVLIGTAIGVLPGLGPVPTIAMLLPITFGLPADTAMIMLAGIFYGAQYGGSTTAILLNIPGETSSVVTTIDGHQMARQGKGGRALATAAIGSFVAGTIATMAIAWFAPPLAGLANSFVPADYFALMVLGLVASVVLASGSLLHAVAMILIGLLLSMIGSDINSGVPRFTFGQVELYDGIEFVAIAMGMFGIGEILSNLDNRDVERGTVNKVSSLMPTREDLRSMRAPILRGTLLGTILGVLPGGGANLASFASYAMEKRMSRHPERFGKGAIEGVAGPEAANNAGAQSAFIPMLTLGIPSNPVMALMIGAMMIQGIQPGPSMLTEQPELFWGLVASMWIGNLMLVILNLPLVGLWVKLLSVPYHLLFPMIVGFCAIGVFTVANSTFDVWLMAGFGVAGYVARKLDAEPAPLMLALVLGGLMEEYLRRALLLSRGDAVAVLTQPIAAILLSLSGLLLLSVVIPSIKGRRAETFREE